MIIFLSRCNRRKKNLDATLALLQERMFNPKFTQSAFDRIMKQNLESFKVAKTQPASVADEVFAKLNYGPNHILGISGDGNEETVKAFTLADMQYYYDNYMTSQGITGNRSRRYQRRGNTYPNFLSSIICPIKRLPYPQ